MPLPQTNVDGADVQAVPQALAVDGIENISKLEALRLPVICQREIFNPPSTARRRRPADFRPTLAFLFKKDSRVRTTCSKQRSADKSSEVASTITSFVCIAVCCAENTVASTSVVALRPT